MAINVRNIDDEAAAADRLIARAAISDARAGERLSGAIDDFLLPDDARLDDRMRLNMTMALTGMVERIEHTLTQHASWLLASWDMPQLADRLHGTQAPVLIRLAAAGVLRDNDLMREMIARARQDVVGELLTPVASVQGDEPSLLTRLANHPDHLVSAAASALFAAEARRRSLVEGVAHTDLPTELHHRLVWWVAGALRQRFDQDDDLATFDRALGEAALRGLAAHDESERLEATGMRLAVAYGATPEALPDLLVEALGDRRLAMFTAFLAHGAGIEYDQARDAVADPDGAKLWLLLRALDCGRPVIARIGLALCEADPRRDLEEFADSLDEIMNVSPLRARAGLAPMRLHPAYRAAVLALAGNARRGA